MVMVKALSKKRQPELKTKSVEELSDLLSTRIKMMSLLTIMQSSAWKSIVDFCLSVENWIACSLMRNVKQQTINLEDGNNRGTAWLQCSFALE